MNKKFFIIFACFSLLLNGLDIFVTEQFSERVVKLKDVHRTELNTIYQYENFLSQLKDAETGQRGYIISGDPGYLLPYQTALAYFRSEEVQDFIAKEEASPDPKIVERIKELQKLQQIKINQLTETIQARKDIGFEKAKKMLLDNHDKRIMDQAREVVKSVTQDGQEILESLNKQITRETNLSFLQMLISDIVQTILLIACLIYIYRYIQKVDKKDKELSQAMQQLNESSAMREAIFNSTNYAIISTTPEGIITSFNPAAEKILGYTSQEVVGKYTPEIFHEKKEMEERAFALFNKLQKKITPDFEVFVTLAKQNIPDINEWTYIRKDGTRLPVQLSIASIKNQDGDIIGFVGIVYDVTERKQFDRIKDEIMNVTSFELREPVAAIKGCFDLLSLQSNLLPDKTKHILEIGKRNCEHLVNLTNDILEIQRIETGKMHFNFKNIDFSAFLHQAIQNNTSLAYQSHVSLVCRFTEPHCFVKVDENQLMQVMNRLISNAIKYSSSEGTVEITGKKIDSKVHIEIKDQGSTLSPEIQSKASQKLTENGSSHQKEGSGLRLNIVKSIIEKHQGIVGFQTDPSGTILWFELPLSQLPKEIAKT